MAKVPMRDVVVLLPGITGSVLQKDGEDLWAVSGQAVWGFLILTGLGGSLDQLRLSNDDPEAPTLDDGITATRLISPSPSTTPRAVAAGGQQRRAEHDHHPPQRASSPATPTRPPHA